jgi:hypothetical protein
MAVGQLETMADAPSQPTQAVAVARLRVAEALLAHARAMGIADLPADRMAQMTDTGVKLLEGLSLSELQNLSPASGAVMTAAMAGFNQVYGQLSETQLRALKLGIDPTNISAVRALAEAGSGAAFFAAGAVGGALAGGRANYRAALDGTDGISSQKMAAYSAQYADVGLATATVALFAKVDLDRGSYDAFVKEGYSGGAIKDAAADTRALGWKGPDAVGDTIHAPDALRDAAIAAVNATTDEDRAKREQELERVYEGLTPEQQQKAAPFIRRLNATHTINAANAPEVARAASDTALASERSAGGDKAQLDAGFSEAAARAREQSVGQVAADADSVFGKASPPPPSKEVPRGLRAGPT